MSTIDVTLYHDNSRIRRWQEIRSRIKRSRGPERLALLRYLGDQIRAVIPTLSRASNIHSDDVMRAMETTSMQAVLIGAWLSLDPGNHTWPGRDRLFAFRPEDRVNACAALAAIGFFPLDKAAILLENADNDNPDAIIPGLECPGASPEKIPSLIWESAIESAKSKRRWRDGLAQTDTSWVDPLWKQSPAAWRTCVLMDAEDPLAHLCLELPSRTGDSPAGLVFIIKAPHSQTSTLVGEWSDFGWDVAVFHRSEYVSMYELLTTASFEKPLAIMLGIGPGASSRQIPNANRRRKETGLLGELSDDKFNEIMGESLW